MSNEEIVNTVNENASAKKTKSKAKKTKTKKSKSTKTAKAKKSTKTKKSKKSVKELEKSLDAVEQVVSTPEVVESHSETTSSEVADVQSSVSADESKYDESIKSIENSMSIVESHIEHMLKTMESTNLTSKDLKQILRRKKGMDKGINKVGFELSTQCLRGWDASNKLLSKKHRTKGKGKTNMNSGIQKPHPAHAKLAKFMGVNEGDPVSRVDALKAVAAYVKEHNLQTESDKRRFKVVDELHELFGVDEMGYTQIMGNLKPFFPPAEKKKSS